MATTYRDNRHPHYDKCPNPYRDPGNDIWEGRRPHNTDPDTKQAEYRTWFGGVRLSQDGEVIYAAVSLNYKVTIYIVGGRLTIHDIRHDGKTDSWAYCADSHGNRLDDEIWPANYVLEDERIDRMLRLSNIDSPIWEPVCKCAREMWLREISTRDSMHQYIPEKEEIFLDVQ